MARNRGSNGDMIIGNDPHDNDNYSDDHDHYGDGDDDDDDLYPGFDDDD